MTGVVYKRLAYKKRANFNFIANRSNFLPSETARLILELYVSNIFQINSRPKKNCKILYCSLKNMSNRIEALGNTKCRNLISFFEKRWIYWKRKAFVESIWHWSFFSELKGYLAKLFLKRLSVSIKRQI